MSERWAYLWIGVSKGGVVYSRTAAAARKICKILCQGHRAKLTPVKAKISFKMPKRKT